MKTKFKDIGVTEKILKALDEMGFESPTEVQEKVIQPILNKNDLIVKSKTGSGKTAAFGIPTLQQIGTESKNPQALILAPTRELAVQVDSDLKQISKYTDLSLTAVYGQHNIETEIKQLEKGVQVVSGTPGRMWDHIQRGTIKTNEVKFLILDEADRMLDMGFIDQVVRIIKKLPKDRVTLLFSASMPFEIQNICWEYMKKPETIEIASETETVDSIKQYYYKVEQREKSRQLNRVILVENPESCIIFCNTRYQVDKTNEYLQRKGYGSQALHGAISQSRRLKTINQFKKGEFTFLVATDVASRGIHVDDMSHVINYDIPVEKDSYVHRIGRTGRAGNGGHAITFATSEDIMSLYEIEEHIGAMIDEKELPTDEEVAANRRTTELALRRNVKPREHNQSHEKKPHGAHGSHGHKPGQKQDHKQGQYKAENRHHSKPKPHSRPHSKPNTKPHTKPVDVNKRNTNVPTQITDKNKFKVTGTYVKEIKNDDKQKSWIAKKLSSAARFVDRIIRW